MKIALAIPSDYYQDEEDCHIPSGIAVYTRGLADALSDAAHDVHILCHQRKASAVVEQSYNHGWTTVHAFSIPTNAPRLMFSEMIHDWLLANPMDVVEAHQWKHPLLVEQMVGGTATVVRHASGFMDSVAGGVPDVASYEGAFQDYEATRKVKWSTHLMENEVVRRADVVLCAGQQSLGGASGLTERARLLPLGIPETTFVDVYPSVKVLVSVSRFSDPRKGGEIVPHILRSIPSQYEVVVVGEINRYEPLVAEMESVRDIELHNEPVSDVQLIDLYRGALAVIVPTKSESFGYNLLEPLAQGRPVICFDQADPSKRQWPLCNLGPWGSPQAIAQIPEVLKFLASQDLLELKNKSRSFAQQFWWPKLIPEYETAYTQAIAHALISGRTRGW